MMSVNFKNLLAALGSDLHEVYKLFLDEFQRGPPKPEGVNNILLSAEVCMPRILALCGIFDGVTIPEKHDLIEWLSHESIFNKEVCEWIVNRGREFPLSYNFAIRFDLVRRLLIDMTSAE
jgi:hypothetical protein